MIQINILEDVEFSDGSTNELIATVTADGAIIRYASAEVSVPWETMDDVEHLSELFADYTVRVFKVVVKLLGSIHSGRDTYKLLF